MSSFVFGYLAVGFFVSGMVFSDCLKNGDRTIVVFLLAVLVPSLWPFLIAVAVAVWYSKRESSNGG